MDKDEKEMMYNVSLAIDGRIDVQVRANSFEEAKKKADTAFGSADITTMECIGWHAVNAEREDGEFRDY